MYCKIINKNIDYFGTVRTNVFQNCDSNTRTRTNNMKVENDCE